MKLLVVFALLVVAVSGCSDRKERAVAAIKKMGGTVTVDWNRPEKPVIGVDFQVWKVTDIDFAHVKEFVNIQSLRLHSADITDSGLLYV